MSYDAVEDGAVAIAYKVKGFTSRNTSKGDYKILGRGITRALIFTPGPFQREVVATPRRLRQAWTIQLGLFIPFQGEVSSISSAIRVVRQTILDEFDQWPTLNSTTGVINAFITGGAEPELWQGENRSYWTQTLTLAIEERTTVTIAE